MNVWYDTAKKWRIWSNVSGYTGPIFTIFTSYESALLVDDGSVAYFPIYHGTLPWQPIMLRKCYQCRLITFAFGALVLENELQYHRLAVRINSTNDASISCQNFVKFGPVTPELTELICEHHSTRPKKLAYISGSTGPIFAIFSPYESNLCADVGSVPYFTICQGTLPWQPNNVTVMKAN